MEMKEILETLRELIELKNDIEKVILDVRNINPDEPIGESRSKMVRDYHFACDVANYGKMVLNDDPHALYLDLAESFRE